MWLPRYLLWHHHYTGTSIGMIPPGFTYINNNIQLINHRMKTRYIILPLLCICTAMAAQNNKHNHAEDSTDVFFRHLNLNEVTVTGVTGDTKLKHATAPVSIVSPQILHATASTNIIDAIAHQPGVSQLTTGGSISKPIIRGLGYNRVVVMSEGVRQGPIKSIITIATIQQIIIIIIKIVSRPVFRKTNKRITKKTPATISMTPKIIHITFATSPSKIE